MPVVQIDLHRARRRTNRQRLPGIGARGRDRDLIHAGRNAGIRGGEAHRQIERIAQGLNGPVGGTQADYRGPGHPLRVDVRQVDRRPGPTREHPPGNPVVPAKGVPDRRSRRFVLRDRQAVDRAERIRQHLTGSRRGAGAAGGVDPCGERRPRHGSNRRATVGVDRQDMLRTANGPADQIGTEPTEVVAGVARRHPRSVGELELEVLEARHHAGRFKNRAVDEPDAADRLDAAQIQHQGLKPAGVGGQARAGAVRIGGVPTQPAVADQRVASGAVNGLRRQVVAIVAGRGRRHNPHQLDAVFVVNLNFADARRLEGRICQELEDIQPQIAGADGAAGTDAHPAGRRLRLVVDLAADELVADADTGGRAVQQHLSAEVHGVAKRKLGGICRVKIPGAVGESAAGNDFVGRIEPLEGRVLGVADDYLTVVRQGQHGRPRGQGRAQAGGAVQLGPGPVAPQERRGGAGAGRLQIRHRMRVAGVGLA